MLPPREWRHCLYNFYSSDLFVIYILIKRKTWIVQEVVSNLLGVLRSSRSNNRGSRARGCYPPLAGRQHVQRCHCTRRRCAGRLQFDVESRDATRRSRTCVITMSRRMQSCTSASIHAVACLLPNRGDTIGVRRPGPLLGGCCAAISVLSSYEYKPR